MSKISEYLNEHILGDVSTSDGTRRAYSVDTSILAMTPDIVVYPRTTNDMRKLARFTFQLAEKGHVISLTPRGGGMDDTGAAISDGIVADTSRYLHDILEYEPKTGQIRVQPGLTLHSLNAALGLQASFIPPTGLDAYSTIGGAVSNNASGSFAGVYGATGDFVEELEVVLANGDLLHTKRISKRELNQKKGLQTFEGEIYRAVDNLIEDNLELIETLGDRDIVSNVGYPGLAKVRGKGGSFDLTPLFAGAQGTLGVISEMILQGANYSGQSSTLAVVFETEEALHDGIDEIVKCNPDSFEIVDARISAAAYKLGKRHPLIRDLISKGEKFTAIGLVRFANAKEGARSRKVKKVLKALKNIAIVENATAHTKEEEDALFALRSDVYVLSQALASDATLTGIFRGVYIPQNRFEEFSTQLKALAAEHKVGMPFTGFPGDSVYSYWPVLSMRTTSDKQKIFKLIDEFTKLVTTHKGSIAAASAEGRLLAPFALKNEDKELVEVYAKLRKIFNPHNTLNTGVKEAVELKDIVSHLRHVHGPSVVHRTNPSV